MSTRVSADVTVQNFGLSAGDDGLRLEFPEARLGPMAGEAGETRWTIAGTELAGLRARLRTGHWQAERGRATGLTLRGPGDAVTAEIAEVELPDGFLIARSPEGVELVAPTATLRGVAISSRGAPTVPEQPIEIAVEEPAPPPVPAEEQPLRQHRLRFLDAVVGELGLTVKVQLDLPVLGIRTLDQTIKVPIERGAIDFRKLDKSLDWLEGTFLDIGMHEGRLAIRWGVPIVAPQREILSWSLDDEARTLAKFDKVPLRSLADFRVGGAKAAADRRSGKIDAKPKKGVLRSLVLDDILVKLSLTVPRSVAIGDGHVLFGGDDAAGIVDLKIAGAVGDGGRAGALRGSIGALDLTLADVSLGGAARVSADRIRLGQLDPIEVQFEGFAIAGLSTTIAEISVTNLRLLLGRAPQPGATTQSMPAIVAPAVSKPTPSS
ncbi:MAG: hypothetical protein R2939_01540 [Kofleriaceae bacterium]